MGPVIQISNINVRYEQQIVLERISLNLEAGEILSIVGPNGGGKTTLLKVILGTKAYEDGTVRIMGRPPGELPPGTIGYLPQMDGSRSRFPIRVLDVVMMARLATRRNRNGGPSDREIVEQALREVDMAEHRSMPFGSLSGGQRQRVLIARALALEPAVLILDEPSTGLDAVSQEDFYRTLTRLKVERKMAILMVSHDIGVVSGYVDRIACLNKQIHYHGSGDKIPDDIMEKVFGRNIQILVHNPDCLTCKGHNHE